MPPGPANSSVAFSESELSQEIRDSLHSFECLERDQQAKAETGSAGQTASFVQRSRSEVSIWRHKMLMKDHRVHRDEFFAFEAVASLIAFSAANSRIQRRSTDAGKVGPCTKATT
jgi:hypothetical protein